MRSPVLRRSATVACRRRSVPARPASARALEAGSHRAIRPDRPREPVDQRLTLRKLIVDWLDDNYLFGEADALIKTDDLSFLENGILDSLGFVRLVLMLEERCRVKIDRKHLTRQNFDSMRKIIAYVAQRAGWPA